MTTDATPRWQVSSGGREKSPFCQAPFLGKPRCMENPFWLGQF